VLKVLAIPAHLEGSGYLRICAPAQAINKLSDGAVHVDLMLAGQLGPTFTGPRGQRQVQDFPALDYDVVVLQLPMVEEVVAMIPHIQAQGIAVVADIDDDIAATPKSNPHYDKIAPETNPASNWRWLKQGCGMADLLTCTTPYLRRYAGGLTGFRHAPTRIIPNAVPMAATYEAKPEIEHTVVGWSGSVVTHDRDLTVTGGGVARAVEGTGAKFLAIGWWHHVAEQLELATEPPATGWLSLAQYYARMPYLDVGIVPLQPSAFNIGKSHLKGLDMAAAGVPFVASPLPAYKELAESGIGWLAESPADWEAKVRQLVTDAPLRTDLSAAYRDTVRRTRTFETCWWRWAEAWQDAADTKRAADERRTKTRGGARATA